jgi:hypothetical protein
MAVRDWSLSIDMNDDGVMDAADLFHLFASIFYYPGDLTLWGLQAIGLGPLRELLEPSDHYFSGYLALVISALLWWIIVSRLVRRSA